MTHDLQPLNPAQLEVLGRALHPERVATRNQGGQRLSYLEAWDVKAHLIRIFGYGGFSSEVLSADLAFQIAPGDGGSNNWDVGYRVLLRLTIHQLGAVYTEAAIGTAHLPQIGEAHDMAIKTAESDALKRCAVNLGTQFGLSLYDNGRTSDVVATRGFAAPLYPLRSESDQAPPPPAEEEAPPPRQPSEAALKAVEALREIAGIAENGERITTVAAAKATYSEVLSEVVEVQGKEITVGRLADLVAAGQFTRASA